MPFLGSNPLGKHCAILSQCAKLFCDLADVQLPNEVTVTHVQTCLSMDHGTPSLEAYFSVCQQQIGILWEPHL